MVKTFVHCSYIVRTIAKMAILSTKNDFKTHT